MKKNGMNKFNINGSLKIEGILNPVHHLGVTDVIWWYKGESLLEVNRFTSASLLCNGPSNFTLDKAGFKVGKI